MTQEFYLKQPKHMIQWKLIKNLPRNPELIGVFDRGGFHPLI